MRNPRLRTSLIATIVAAVIAVGTPVVSETWNGAVADARETRSRVGRVGWPSAFADRGRSAPVGAAREAVDAARRAERRHDRHRRRRAAATHLLVRIPRPMTVRARPDRDAAAVGTMSSVSKYYGVPISAWVEETSKDARWGRVEIPYVWPRREGWIRSVGCTELERTWRCTSICPITVSACGSSAAGCSGCVPRPARPSRRPHRADTSSPIASRSRGADSLGTFAFGISGIQPKLPPGWSGGNQLAIHGTNDASSIGTSASAGCLRVSERGLDRLLPLLRLGTPVIVER